MQTSPRILFAGGGTGGHVYPAIAIADAVRRIEPEAAIAFAGTRERIEWTAVPKAGYPIHPITVTGFQRALSLRNLIFPWKLAQGLLQGIRLVVSFDPHVVVGTGGYVSGPVLLAAALLGRPIVIQEQNAYAGVTNKLLSRYAYRIHIAFKEAERYFPVTKCVLSGNPTRRELLDADPSEARRFFDLPPDARVLVVFGGSLGSAALNEAMAGALDALLTDERHHVIWQTGGLYFDRIRARVPDHPRLRLFQFVDRMDLAYAAADLALCRAGAITCSELLVTGTPAVLVPSPNVAEDHQTKNAQAMASGGAALLLPETDLEARLVPEVTRLLPDDGARAAMRARALEMARPDAADRIARSVLEIAGTRGRSPGGGDQGKESSP